MLKKLKFLIFCAFVVCAAMPATVYAESFTTQNAAVETITQHTLTFNPNCTDDSYFISESSIDIPESHKYGTLPVPSRKGYEFLGWYTASDGGNKVSESTVMGSSDTIVYAHWTAYTITINYHNDGAQTWHSYCANAVNSCTTLTSLNRNLPPMTQRIPMQSTVFWMSAASQKQDTKPAIAGKLGPKTVP